MRNKKPIKPLSYLRSVCLLSLSVALLYACNGKSENLIFSNGYQLDSSGHHVITGDLNSDDLDDIIVLFNRKPVGTSLSGFQVLLSESDGSHSVLPHVELNFKAKQIGIADLDSDGLDDLLLLNTDSQLFAFTNQGDGHFSHAERFDKPSITDISSFELAHINEDMQIDIVIAGPSGLELLQSSGGTNYDSKMLAQQGAYSVKAADLNADGFTDLLFRSISAQRDVLHLLTGDGQSNFRSTVYTSPFLNFSRIQLGHANNDNLLDVLLDNPGYGNGKIWALTSEVDGTFTQLLGLNPNNTFDIDMFYTDSAVFLDLNCDRVEDIVVLEFDHGDFKSLINEGSGVFTRGQTINMNEHRGSLRYVIKSQNNASKGNQIIGLMNIHSDELPQVEIYSGPNCDN